MFFRNFLRTVKLSVVTAVALGVMILCAVASAALAQPSHGHSDLVSVAVLWKLVAGLLSANIVGWALAAYQAGKILGTTEEQIKNLVAMQTVSEERFESNSAANEKRAAEHSDEIGELVTELAVIAAKLEHIEAGVDELLKSEKS